MEKAFGEVKSIRGEMAEILIERGSMCGDSCSNCGMCSNKKSKVIAKNLPHAKEGDRVALSLSSSKGLLAAILAYLVPVMLLMVVSIVLINAGLSEGLAVLVAFAVMAVWFLLVFIADKKGAFKEKISVEIIEIIKEA